MRVLESLLLVAVVAAFLSWVLRGRSQLARRCFLLASGAGALLLLLHLLFEGGRWQMLLAYGLAVIFAALAIRRRSWWKSEAAASHPGARPRRRSFWRKTAGWTGVLGAALLVILAVALPALFPVNVLPAPTGPYAVGTTRLNLVDTARPEPFTPNPADKRELEIVGWYPAAPHNAREAPLWGNPKLIAGELAKGLNLPGFILSHLALSPSHARINPAAAANGRPFPTLIFSHGYAQGFAAQNSALFEDLASHGYVILAINHPYEGLVATRGDGSVARTDTAQVRKLSKEVGEAFPLIEAASRAGDPATADQKIGEALRRMPVAERSLNLWVGDIAYLLGQLPRLNAAGSGSPLAGAIDLTRIGTMGMSFGAAAATQACADLGPCKAAVNLDGTPIGRVVVQGLPKPVLFMTSDNADVNRANMTIFRRAGSGSVYGTLKGASHLDYSDLTLLSPVFRWMGALGPIGGAAATSDTRTIVLSFLDRRLKGAGAAEGSAPANVKILARK